MTLDEFFIEVAKLKPFVDPLEKEKSLIRFLIQTNGEYRCFCPITAVCYTTKGQFFWNSTWDLAADLIGLHIDQAIPIVQYSDGRKDVNSIIDMKFREALS